MAPRNEAERKARYKEARARGYTPAEARRYRDLAQTQQRRTRPGPSESVSEQDTVAGNVPRSYQSDSRRDRLDNYRRWSGQKAFPAEFEAWITNVNVANHRDPLSGYGYRIFYHRYVNQVEPVEARRRVERRDT